MRFTCRLCFHPADTAGHLLAHVATAHPEMGEVPTTWPHGPDVEVETAVGQTITGRGFWRREDWL